MSVKIFDTMTTATPNFPLAYAEKINVKLQDGTEDNLQNLFDNGELGGGDTSIITTEAEYLALPEEQKLNNSYYLYDIGVHYKNGVAYSRKEPIQLTMEEYKALGEVDPDQEYIISANSEGILLEASDIGYSNAVSNLPCTTVQGAIDKVVKTVEDAYAKKTDIPTTLPANGGNADTVNNHTVKSDVPENAVFTDTIYDGIIAELNANLNREIGRATEADEILKSRVDNITSLSEGSTTGDAELQDIRVKVDGTTATSAGNAVREQISKLKSDVNAKVPSILLKGGFQVVAYSEREISGNSKLECLENWITNALSKYINNSCIIGNIYNINYVDGFAIVNVWGDDTKGILGASGILVDQNGIYYYKKINGASGSGTLTKIN